MAEGGGDEKEENPFSFKKFVNKKDKTQESRDNENADDNEDTEFGFLPDVSRPGRSKERTNLVVTDDKRDQQNNAKKQKKKQNEDNPFSFKKFLESGSGSRPKPFHNHASNSPPARHKKDSSTGLSRTAPDFASDLPDFVQDHFSDFGRERGGSRELELPDFAPTSSASYNETHSDVVPSPARGSSNWNTDRFSPLGSSQGRGRSRNGSGSLSDSVSDLVSDNKVPVSLPDFLSDGVFSNSDGLQDEPSASFHNGVNSHSLSTAREGVAALEINGDLELEVRRLREENSLLRLELQEARQEAVTETQRCHKMKKDMEVQQKKEAEETAALERIVQQVEANLTTTTQRAVKAENTVSRLQGEIKSLQATANVLRSENEALRSGDHGLTDIRQRTRHVSEQLSSAARSAEQNLKHLMQGVENLNFLSQVLMSVDKIQEEEQPEDKKYKERDKHKEDGQE